jgi:phage/plasmid-like protein (TIGR03299 family)
MSQETSRWLNTMTLIGFTDKRGHAWHYREEMQGDEPNHYPGAIPEDDILRRLFNFDVNEEPLYTFNNQDGTFKVVEGRKAMVTSDTHETLGVFKEGYQGHSYREWLLKHVGSILNGRLSYASAGLLKNRAIAWVQVEAPETIKTAQGVAFRPFLLATTSYDGSLASTYKNGAQLVVCDNTLAAAMGERANTYKVKHSKNSGFRLANAQEAFGLVEETAEHFEAEISRLCSWQVTDKQFNDFLSKLVPVPALDPNANTRGRTMAISKAETIRNLYETDERAAPWRGTAFGVLQATNTYNHHEAAIRGGVHRGIRNMENVVSGKFETADNDALALLAEICEREYA